MGIGAAIGAVIGMMIAEWWIRRRRRDGYVSAAWFKDRLQLGREQHG